MSEENKTEQIAQQLADQIAQQVGQAVGETIRQVVNATLTARPQEVGAESEFETGMDEFFKFGSQLAVLNGKRTYDEFQDVSLVSARRSQTDYDTIRAYAQLALNNAVNNADMLAKQAIAHRDIAIERQWNLNDDTLALKVVADVVDDEDEG